METVQLLFRTRGSHDADTTLDKAQWYLAALLKNGQIAGDYPAVAKGRHGYIAVVSLPEHDALDDRFANKWVRKALRGLAAVGVERLRLTRFGPDPESRAPSRSRHDSALSTDGRELARAIQRKAGIPVYYYLYKHFGRGDAAERRRRCPSCGKAWLRGEPLHKIFDFPVPPAGGCRPSRLT